MRGAVFVGRKDSVSVGVEFFERFARVGDFRSVDDTVAIGVENGIQWGRRSMPRPSLMFRWWWRGRCGCVVCSLALQSESSERDGQEKDRLFHLVVFFVPFLAGFCVVEVTPDWVSASCFSERISLLVTLRSVWRSLRSVFVRVPSAR